MISNQVFDDQNYLFINKNLNKITHYGFMTEEIYQQLNDEKDWRARTSAIEEVLKLIENLNVRECLELHLLDFMSLLLKLNNDQNFKISLVSLKILNIIINIQKFKEAELYQILIPKMIEKLGDSKVVIRQAASKIIKDHFKLYKTPLWIDQSLKYLSERNQNLKEEVLNLLIHIYQEENYISYNWEKVLKEVHPLIEDNKTKIKIKCLECLVVVTLKNNRQQCKGYLSQKLNQVYFDMYLDKLSAHSDNSKTLQDDKINTKFQQNDQNYMPYKTLDNPNAYNDSMDSFIKNNTSQKNRDEDNIFNKQSDKNDVKNINFLMMDDSRISAKTANTMNSSQNTMINSQQRNIFDNSTSIFSRSTIRPLEEQKIKVEDSQKIDVKQDNHSIESSAIVYNNQTFLNKPQKNMPDNQLRVQSALQQVESVIKDEKRITSAIQSNLTQNNQVYSDNSFDPPLLKMTNISDYSNYTINRKESIENEQKIQLCESPQKNHDSQLSNLIVSEIRISQNEQTIQNNKLNLYKGGSFEVQNSISSVSAQLIMPQEEEHKNYQYKPPLQKKKQQKKQDNLSNNVDSLSSKTNNQLIIQSKQYQDKTQKSEEEIKIASKPFQTKKTNHNKSQEEEESKDFDENDDKSKQDQKNQQKKQKNQQQKNNETQQQHLKSNLDSKNCTYFEKEELNPQNDPEKAMKNAINDLKSDNWANQFSGINVIRSLFHHHSDFVQNYNNLHGLVTEILKLVESLRSGLAKNAMIALTEMAACLKRKLDQELEHIILKLLKKGQDANAFISKEVRECLTSVCQNCTDSKVIQLLITYSNNRSILFKFNVALCLETLIIKNPNRIMQLKDVENFMVVLCNYTQDNAMEVRTVAKRAFTQLYKSVLNKNEIENLIKRLFNETTYQKLMQMIEKSGSCNFLITNNNCLTNNPNLNQTKSKITSNLKKDKKGNMNYTSKEDIRQSDEYEEDIEQLGNQTDMKASKSKTSYNQKTNTIKIKKDPPEFEQLPQYFINAENSDWKNRFQTVNSLQELAKDYSEELSFHKLSQKFIDTFMKLCNDSNIKVSICALNSFGEIIEQIQVLIENNLAIVMNSLFTTFASSNPQVKQCGESSYEIIKQTLDSSILFPHLCQGALYAQQKARVFVIMKLENICDIVYSQKPQIFVKNISNALYKLLDDNKGELKNASNNLTKKCYQILGDQLFTQCQLLNQPKKIQQINEILSL